MRSFEKINIRTRGTTSRQGRFSAWRPLVLGDAGLPASRGNDMAEDPRIAEQKSPWLLPLAATLVALGYYNLVTTGQEQPNGEGDKKDRREGGVRTSELAAPPRRRARYGEEERSRAWSPSEIPARGSGGVFSRVYAGLFEQRVPAIAAGVAFYALLAIFPAIAALVSIYSLYADPGAISSHLNMASGWLPEEALQVVDEQIKRVTAQGRATLGVASALGLLFSLWSANAGTKALFDALNVVYQEREKRGFFGLNVASLFFTLLAIALVIGAILVLAALDPILAAFSPLVAQLDALLKRYEFTAPAHLVLQWARWPILFAFISLWISLLYRFGPSRRRPRWRWITWGSVLATLVLIGLSSLFPVYAENFGRFNETYGSLGAVIGFMLWLWISSIVLLVGAMLDAELERRTVLDTTVGAPRALGTRGAAADTIGETI
jgi:membrane protein